MITQVRLGALSVLGVVVASIVLPWDASALSDTPDANVPEANGVVMAVFQSGTRVYVGGDFTQIGGVSRTRLAAFDSTTGVVDAAWDPDVNGQVNAIYVSGSMVYVGGAFTDVNSGTTRNRLAAFNLADGVDTGAADATWNPNADGTVYAIWIDGTKVYVGGAFTDVNGGTTRNRIAALDSTSGTADASWDPNINGTVRDILVNAPNVYVSGAFTDVNGGTTRNRAAALELANDSNAGTADAVWNPDINGTVYAIEVYNLYVFLGGDFTTVNGGTARVNLMVCANANGVNTGAVHTWNPNPHILGGGGAVYALEHNNNLLHVGGLFNRIVNDTEVRVSLAAWSTATWMHAVWNPDLGPAGTGSAEVIATSGASGVIVGGTFTSVGGAAKDRLAGFDSTVPVELSVFKAE